MARWPVRHRRPTPCWMAPDCTCRPAHLNYRSPASIDNTQQNITQEIRLQSNDPSSALNWTTGVFYTHNRQTYLELIHDPLLNELSLAATGLSYDNWFQDCSSGTCVPVLFDPRFPNDSYFLQTKAIDQQIAWFGEGTLQLHRSVQTDRGRALLALEIHQHHAHRRPAVVPVAADGQRNQGREFLHAQGELRLSVRPEKPVLRELCQGIQARRCEQSRAVCGVRPATSPPSASSIHRRPSAPTR